MTKYHIMLLEKKTAETFECVDTWHLWDIVAKRPTTEECMEILHLNYCFHHFDRCRVDKVEREVLDYYNR